MTAPEIETKFNAAYEFFLQELNGIRTGRASPALVENISVSCYQSRMPLKSVAGITTPEPNALLIEVWDSSLAQEVERALSQSDIGSSPQREGNRIHVVLAPLTEERRNEFLRAAKKKAENAKVSIRTIREEAMKALQKQKLEENLSETLLEQEKKNIQKRVEEENARVDAALEKKENELQTI